MAVSSSAVAITLILSLHSIRSTHSTTSIEHAETWHDDFALDATGVSGWSLVRVSDYELPAAYQNPSVTVNGERKYHGPFPAAYKMQRSFRCNTRNETRMYVSFRASYCNTDKTKDVVQLHIGNYSSSSYKLNDATTALDPSDLSAVQQATALFYTNHTSSTTEVPQCSLTSAYDTTSTTTSPSDSHLPPGQWFSFSSLETADTTIIGGRTYTVSVEMDMNGADEYVLVSEIAILCVDLMLQTASPTERPTQTSSHPPSNVDIVVERPLTQRPMLTGSLSGSNAPTLSPTTWMPSRAPSASAYEGNAYVVVVVVVAAIVLMLLVNGSGILVLKRRSNKLTQIVKHCEKREQPLTMEKGNAQHVAPRKCSVASVSSKEITKHDIEDGTTQEASEISEVQVEGHVDQVVGNPNTINVNSVVEADEIPEKEVTPGLSESFVR